VARQPRWYRGRSRTYLNSRQARDARRARKLRAELGMEPTPHGGVHVGPRGGKYLARGRLYCRACGHLAIRHSPTGGCGVGGCACDEAWRP
jgi:hypothetical protein